MATCNPTTILRAPWFTAFLAGLLRLEQRRAQARQSARDHYDTASNTATSRHRRQRLGETYNAQMRAYRATHPLTQAQQERANARSRTHNTRQRRQRMLALYQSGYPILGIGVHLSQCLRDAAQWGFEITREQVEDRTTSPRRGEEHGALYLRRMTPALAAAVEEHGGDLVYETNADGLLCLPEELETEVQP